MKFTLKRVLATNLATFGVLLGDDFPLCCTLEKPWLNNQPSVSSIPAGTYQVGPHDSPSHPDTFEIQNVPGRSGILIHAGNTPSDSQGCILVGLQFHGTGVQTSQGAMTELRTVLPDYFTLEIIDP